MVSKVIFQSPPPIDLTHDLDLSADKKTCSNCGSNSTLVYRNKEQWRYNQQKKLLCKKCYHKEWRIDHKEIDLSKLKRVANKEELTFAKKPAENKIEVKKKRKSYHNMSFKEIHVAQERFRKIFNKKRSKKLKQISAEKYYPFITNLFSSDSGVCMLCGGSMYYGGIALLIPNLKTSDNTLELCHDCVKSVYRVSSGLKIESKANGLLHGRILERDRRCRDQTVSIPRNKGDNRDLHEIREEIEKEARKELGIQADFPV